LEAILIRVIPQPFARCLRHVLEVGWLMPAVRFGQSERAAWQDLSSSGRQHERLSTFQTPQDRHKIGTAARRKIGSWNFIASSLPYDYTRQSFSPRAACKAAETDGAAQARNLRDVVSDLRRAPRRRRCGGAPAPAPSDLSIPRRTPLAGRYHRASA